MKSTYECFCENCHRPQSKESIVKVNEQHHIAYLCQTCSYIFNEPNQKARLLDMIRSKTMEQSNQEMQSIHKMMTMLIWVGVLFLFVISAVGIGVSLDAVQPNSLTFKEDFLSLIQLSFIK